MSTSMTIDFCKNEDCPSSNELLEYQVGELSRGRNSEVLRHLMACDFCAAEVDFYSHYPQEENFLDFSPESIKIPGPLFELAEALLKNRGGDSRQLNELLHERDGLVLDKA